MRHIDPDFAGRLFRLREAQSLKPVDVAKRLHVSPTAISYYESGQKMPSYQTIKKLAVFYKVSADYLLGLEGKRMISVDGLSEKQVQTVQNIIDTLRDDK